MENPANRRYRPRALSCRGDELCHSIIETVHDIEPDAEVILYGSRARGDARPDSDWDLVILLDRIVDTQREETLSRRLYELELSSDQVICPMILSRQDWQSPRYRAMPFHQNVEREGVVLSDRGPGPSQGGAAHENTMSQPTTLRKLRSRIQRAVRSVAPDAEIILYGPRARGEAAPESGWDLLILLDGALDPERETAICRRLYELEWDAEEVLCPIVLSKEDWRSSRFRATPFHNLVDGEGIAL